jgi:two-component system sensor histidine kinase/response regulator
MSAPLPKTMLIIEDDAGLRVTLAAAAESVGYTVQGCDSADEGFRQAVAFKPALIFCDVHLAKGDGRSVLTRLRADAEMSDCQFVMMTGDWVGASQQASIEIAADAYLAKPFSLKEFLACAEERYQQANL